MWHLTTFPSLYCAESLTQRTVLLSIEPPIYFTPRLLTQSDVDAAASAAAKVEPNNPLLLSFFLPSLLFSLSLSFLRVL